MINQEVNKRIARELFGWRWMSWIGIPTKGTPGYPKECRVRQLLSPVAMEKRGSDYWRAYLADRDWRDADGSEPLAYCYCSSMGPEMVPDFGGEDDVKVLVQVRKLWKKHSTQWRYFRGCLSPAENYRVGDYSCAAIVVLDLANVIDESKPETKQQKEAGK